MGTHPNAPSMVVIPGKPDKPLSDWVAENPDKLGDRVNKQFHGSLPFLFKVLSVDKALSIQAHPNKVSSKTSGLPITQLYNYKYYLE